MENDGEAYLKKGKAYNLASSRTFEPTMARNYFELAAKAGNREATRCLALMMHQGEGGPKDFQAAVRLLSNGYFGMHDTEALTCLVDMLEDESEAGRTIVERVNLIELADQLNSMQKMTERVLWALRRLVAPVHSD